MMRDVKMKKILLILGMLSILLMVGCQVRTEACSTFRCYYSNNDGSLGLIESVSGRCPIENPNSLDQELYFVECIGR